MKRDKFLTPAAAERAAFICDLAKLVCDMIPDGAPGAENFDAERWVVRWLKLRQPALAGRTLGSYLGTVEGRAVVHRLLMQSMTGTYA
jgi:hypothetical protein